MTTRAYPLLALALAVASSTSCDYEAPLNDQYKAFNSISGTIVADGVAAPNHVFVFVFDAKNPPPPIGTGAPYTFTTVSSMAFTGDEAGVQSAPYTIPYLPDTNAETGFEAGFLVTALIDTDGNFNPFADSLAGSSCTDWLGEHKASVTDPYPVPVFVEGGKIKDDVTVVISRQNLSQRPAFTLAEPELVISKEIARQSLLDQGANTQTYRILATPVHTEFPGECPKTDKECDALALDFVGPCAQDPAINDTQCTNAPACSCPDAIQEPCATGFPLHFNDKTNNQTGEPGADGFHDFYPAELQAANGIKDTWPRVYLEYMGTPTSDDDGRTIFENDLGAFEWPRGSGRMVNERWVAENYPLALELNFLGPTLLAPGGSDPFAPFRAKEVNLTFSPAFRHYNENGTYDEDIANGPFDLYDLRCFADPGFGDGQFPSQDEFQKHPASCVDGQPVVASDVPNGAWKMIMVTENGQSWRVPNEIGLPAWAEDDGVEAPLESTSPDFEVDSQAVYLLLDD